MKHEKYEKLVTKNNAKTMTKNHDNPVFSRSSAQL